MNRLLYHLRFIVLLCVFVLATHTPLCAQIDDIVVPKVDSVVVLTTDGVKSLFLYRDEARAQAELERALELDSTYAPAHFSLAQILLYSDVDASLMHAKTAYQSDTTNYWYLDAYGNSLLATQDYDTAKGVYERIIELDPRDVNGYRVLAILYQRDNKPNEAISLLDTADMRVGRNPYLFDLKRQLLLATGQTDRAVREAKEMVEQSPYDLRSRVDLAELYSSTGADSLAYVEYLEALSIDSMSFVTLASLGSFMNRRGEYDDYLVVLKRLMRSAELAAADKVSLIEEIMSNREIMRQPSGRAIISVVEELAREHPNDPAVVNLQSNYYIVIGDLEMSVSVVKSRLGDEPRQAEYYRRVIDLERYLGRIDSVERYLIEAVERFPDDEMLRVEWAHTLAFEGRYDDAVEAYEQILVMEDDSLRGVVWGLIGDVQLAAAMVEKGDSVGSRRSEKEAQRRVQLSLDAYKESLKYQADNAMVLNNYAYTLCEHSPSKRLKEALQLSKQAIELVTGSPTYLDTYAWILYKLGDYEEAKVVMRQALSLDTSQNPEIALHYGSILCVLGEMTMAEYYWGKAKEWGGDIDDHINEGRAEAMERRKEVEAAARKAKEAKDK